MKKIVLLSGKRGGYGAMKGLMKRLKEDDDIIFKLVLTDQHTSNKFGNTSLEVDKDFPENEKISMGDLSTSSNGRCIGLSTFMEKFSDYMRRENPDYCILYGDRSEVVIASVVCNIHQIPIIHIQGGDLSGSSDENFRHAITKMSHIHYPSCEESARRLRQLGEKSEKIVVVGDCHIDHIKSKERYTKMEVVEELGLDINKKIIVLLQYSETTESENSYQQMIHTLSAVSAFDEENIIAIYPCSDPGYEGILKAYKEYEERIKFKLYKNIDAPVFAGLLSIADVMIGNSSCGIIETSIFGTPTINIGRRQNGRMSSSNILNVGHTEEEIEAAILFALGNEEFRKKCSRANNPYGDGRACDKIYQQIKMLGCNGNILQKEFVDYDE